MNKPDNSAGGLLSKMVRVVRNPTVDWSEIDAVDDNRESQYSKLMLKEMIERKRRNDFVRKREFDQLRKLRRKEAPQDQVVEIVSAPSSLFASSTSSTDDRADTLKKIDAIEEQMSQQWWKSKTGNLPLSSAGADSQAPLLQAPPPTSAPAIAPADQGGGGAAFHSIVGSEALAFAPTAPLELPPLPSQAVAGTVTTQTALPLPDLPNLPDFPDFAQPSLVIRPPVLPLPYQHDPAVEEAAILFANADYIGAEVSLKDVLAQHALEPAGAPLLVWLALFDLYRATGQAQPFHELAVEFAGRFGRSAPLWFSMLDQADAGVLELAPHDPAVPQRSMQWTAPVQLTAQNIATLQALTQRSAPPWSLNWGRLQDLDASAVVLLAQLFEAWAGDSQVQLHFGAATVLRQVVQQHAPSGDRQVEPQWWRLHMALLRLLGLEDDFELVALDYCVTYEVSPPAWERPLSSIGCDDLDIPQDLPEVADSVLPGQFANSVPFGMSVLASLPTTPPARLSGQVTGDAMPVLVALDDLMQPGQALLVDCEQLLRMDFVAAGSTLNWAAAHQAAGQQLRFVNLHHLTATFFNIVGVNEHALVELRP